MDFVGAIYYPLLDRNYMFHMIQKGLEHRHRFLYIGEASPYKTAIANSYWIHHPGQYAIGETIANETEFQQKGLEKTIARLSLASRACLVIDDFERYDDPDNRLLVQDIMARQEPSNVDVILVSRPDPRLRSFDQTIAHHFPDQDKEPMVVTRNVEGRPPEEMWERLSNLLRGSGSDDTWKNVQAQDIMNVLMTGIYYHNADVHTQNGQVQLLNPLDHKILTDIKTIERDFLSLIKKNPHELHHLTPREFETFIADLYRKQGFDVTLTQQTHDGGKDFIITNKSLLGNLLIYGQVKKNSPDRPVGIGIIKELHATVVMDKASAGIVVASSYFTTDAQQYARQIQHTMSLVDYVNLNKMIQSIS